MARLLADENIPLSVVWGLRKRGHDVLTMVEAGMANQRTSDRDVIAFATSHRRAVITINRRDFIRLHSQNPNHAGIIICTLDRNFESQTERIDKAVKDTPALEGMLIRVVRPQQ